ncbi:unnamed protein product [Bursaphelenchus xylophilus]|uniref:(pine wood nematode) hypothetical protein n=1 Tax=Bursaphelenchus xylophilus TaxID=6326 RepID=A0A1I7SL49_BURXY|nr:unnamed protein product [Bursaphelenchus xylophilus]CAG9129368.1 unnamed protein product [Bursaphelenchus xylophilus]
MITKFLCIVTVVTLSEAEKLNSAEQNFVLNLQNSYRRQLASGSAETSNGFMPAGGDIYELTYDSDLEDKAEQWAENCKFEHPTNIDYGQNIAMRAPAFGSTDALREGVNSWWGEIKDYTATNKLNFASTTGHFTQLAKGRASKVGCAVHNCTTGLIGFDSWTFTVCNYDVGNIVGQDLYTLGNPCSNCERRSACHKGLCVA